MQGKQVFQAKNCEWPNSGMKPEDCRLMKISSRIKEGLRELGNRLSGFSAKRLRQRIGNLESLKEKYQRIMASDKAIYMIALKHIMTVLSGIALGGGLNVVERAVRNAAK
jgi:hypothetical protein